MTPMELNLLHRKLQIESLLSRPLVLSTSEREGLERDLAGVVLEILMGYQER